jgi:hypothetical protein
MTDPLQLVLSRLPTAKPAGKDQWTASSPAHDDWRPSLSIARGADGTVLLKCHGGCDTAAVVSALGLTMRDLFPSANSRAHLKPKRKAKNTGGTSARSPKVYPSAMEAVASLEKQHGPRSALWTYHDAEDEPVGVVVRWDLTT